MLATLLHCALHNNNTLGEERGSDGPYPKVGGGWVHLFISEVLKRVSLPGENPGHLKGVLGIQAQLGLGTFTAVVK